MRRITLWITVTLAVAALLLAFQLSRSGTGGMPGGTHGGSHSEPADHVSGNHSQPANHHG
jgi:hypothetical protein